MGQAIGVGVFGAVGKPVVVAVGIGWMGAGRDLEAVAEAVGVAVFYFEVGALLERCSESEPPFATRPHTSQ